jgi:hypothetical protein
MVGDDMPNMSRFLLALVVFFCFFPCIASADCNDSSVKQAVVIYKQYTLTRSMGIEAFVEVGVGILALVLFVVSALAYYRDRRRKFLIVCMAFLVFAFKGFLGMLDILFPGDSSFLFTFSDLLDFVILFLLFVAVMKD